MGLPKGFMRVLDDEWCFNYYYKPAPEGMGTGGSYKKLHEQAIKRFPVNPKTGQPITEGAVTFSVYRHLARNYQNPEVKNAVLKYWLDYGISGTDEDYLHYVSSRAKNAFAPSQYRTFIREHPELPVIG